MVLPVGGVDSTGTLPAVLRRDMRPSPSHINPLFRHSLQISSQISDESMGVDEADVLTAGGGAATNPWCNTLRHVGSIHEPSQNSSSRPNLNCGAGSSQAVTLKTTDHTSTQLRWPPRDIDNSANNIGSRSRSPSRSRRASFRSSGEIGPPPRSRGTGSPPRSEGIGSPFRSGNTGSPPSSGGIGLTPRLGETGSSPRSGGIGSPIRSGGTGSTSGSIGTGSPPILGETGSTPESGCPPTSRHPQEEIGFTLERSSEPSTFSENEGLDEESYITQTRV